MTVRIVNIALAAVTVAAAFAPVAAGAQVASVSYHRYELATPDGQRAVVTRIQRAATRACTSEGTLREIVARRICTAELGGEMIAQIGNPATTMLWSGHGTQVASR